MKHQHINDAKRIVRLLTNGGQELSNLAMAKVLSLPNPANRISDARKLNAPITDRWARSENGKRFKYYRVTSRKAAKEWLKRA